MNKKLIIMAMALTLPLTVVAFPGGYGGGPGGGHANRMERLTEKLDLTDDQKSKLEIIFKEQGEKYKAIKAETHERMGQVLTGDQMQKMQKMKKNRQEKRQNKKALRQQNQ